jgi:hypothetical protein
MDHRGHSTLTIGATEPPLGVLATIDQPIRLRALDGALFVVNAEGRTFTVIPAGKTMGPFYAPVHVRPPAGENGRVLVLPARRVG